MKTLMLLTALIASAIGASLVNKVHQWDIVNQLGGIGHIGQGPLVHQQHGKEYQAVYYPIHHENEQVQLYGIGGLDQESYLPQGIGIHPSGYYTPVTHQGAVVGYLSQQQQQVSGQVQQHPSQYVVVPLAQKHFGDEENVQYINIQGQVYPVQVQGQFGGHQGIDIGHLGAVDASTLSARQLWQQLLAGSHQSGHQGADQVIVGNVEVQGQALPHLQVLVPTLEDSPEGQLYSTQQVVAPLGLAGEHGYGHQVGQLVAIGQQMGQQSGYFGTGGEYSPAHHVLILGGQQAWQQAAGHHIAQGDEDVTGPVGIQGVLRPLQHSAGLFVQHGYPITGLDELHHKYSFGYQGLGSAQGEGMYQIGSQGGHHPMLLLAH